MTLTFLRLKRRIERSKNPLLRTDAHGKVYWNLQALKDASDHQNMILAREIENPGYDDPVYMYLASQVAMGSFGDQGLAEANLRYFAALEKFVYREMKEEEYNFWMEKAKFRTEKSNDNQLKGYELLINHYFPAMHLSGKAS